MPRGKPESGALRKKLHTIIFEAETPYGKIFDVVLIATIMLSVLVVMLDSIAGYRASHGPLLTTLEYIFTALFTIEYALRLYCVRRPLAYALSFYGIIDLLAILPTWLVFFFPATQYLAVIRILRVLRIFRVLKLAQYVKESRQLLFALVASRRKITVFFFTVLTLVTVFGSLLYVIEGAENGFTSIPVSIYWAIVTLTTVGYGDISPQTPQGQALASLIMVLGYSIIAVPTGIVTVELSRSGDTKDHTSQCASTEACPRCGRDGHDIDALYCKYCGEKL